MNELQSVSNDDHFQTLMRQANALAKSDLLPAHFKGKPANVFLALQFCESVGLDYFTGLQGIYVVHGRTSLYTPLLIALANQRGPFDGPIRFDTTGRGDTLSVTAFGMIGDERYEKTVSMAMAKAEGWTKNPKYKTIPDQMLSYRAATFLIRTYCPEVTGCTLTSDEVRDIEAAGPRVAQAEVVPEGVAAELNARIVQPKRELTDYEKEELAENEAKVQVVIEDEPQKKPRRPVADEDPVGSEAFDGLFEK